MPSNDWWKDPEQIDEYGRMKPGKWTIEGVLMQLTDYLLARQVPFSDIYGKPMEAPKSSSREEAREKVGLPPLPSPEEMFYGGPSLVQPYRGPKNLPFKEEEKEYPTVIHKLLDMWNTRTKVAKEEDYYRLLGSGYSPDQLEDIAPSSTKTIDITAARWQDRERSGGQP